MSRSSGIQYGGGRRLSLLSLFVTMTFALAASAQSALPSNQAPAGDRVAAQYAALPLAFEANRGQADAEVRFVARGQGYSLLLTDSEALLSLRKAEDCTADVSPAIAPGGRTLASCASRQDLVRMKLAGVSTAAVPHAAGEEELPGKVNYFVGKDPAKWRSDLPTYSKVRYSAVYPGIDLVYYGNQRQLEYDFLVAPGASPAAIRLSFSGQKRLRIDRNGDLAVEAADGSLTFHKPVLYQTAGDGKRQPVAGAFKLVAKNTIGFTPGAYDPARPLVIDPVLTYSSFFGTSSTNGATESVASSIALDSAGNVFLAGYTTSGSFPLVNPVDKSLNLLSGTGFVSKINAAGTALLYSTYLGGSGSGRNGDSVTAIAVDAAGSAYVTGNTLSSDFPTMNPIQSSPRGVPDAFVAKLSPTGSTLEYSTYLGGSGFDFVSGIAVDAAGAAYVTGGTASSDFPTASPFQASLKSTSGNGFITKINSAGSALVYSTYLGGSGPGFQGASYNGDFGAAIAVDAGGNAYVTGTSDSPDFPTLNPLQPNWDGHGTGFVTKINPDGAALEYSTYLGEEYPQAIAVDSAGDAILVGSAYTPGFRLFNAVQWYEYLAPFGGAAAFVTKLDPSGTGFIFSTYLSGTKVPMEGGSDVANAVATDAAGSVYVAGQAASTGFPVTADALLAANTINGNAFLVKYSPQGDLIDYATYLGSSPSSPRNLVGHSQANGIAVDSAGHVFVTGYTLAADFPLTSGALESTNPGVEAFLTEFTFPLTSPTTTTVTADSDPQSLGAPSVFKATVTPATGPGVPTGRVKFLVDGKTVAVVTLNPSGHAYYTTAPLALGAHPIQAVYMGDASFEASNGTITETLVNAGVVTVSGANQATVYGTPFPHPLVVLVKDTAGAPIIGKAVSFSGAGLSFSPPSPITNSTGDATTTVTPTQAGAFTATASIASSPAASFALTVSKAPLIVIARSVASTYGKTPAPPTGYVLSGFVNGDTASVVSGAPVLSTNVTATTPAGAYPIGVQVGTLTAANYTFKTTGAASGAVQVYKAPLTVSANHITMKAGSAVPPLTYTLAGFANGETSSVVSGAPVLATTATSTSKPGNYPITVAAGTLGAANYSFTPVNGYLTVTP